MFPEYTMDDAAETRLDRARVNLSNRGIMPKSVPRPWTVRMTLELWRDLHLDMGYSTGLAYSRWLVSGRFTAFRGEHGDKPKASLESSFGDFTLDRDMAVRFTQDQWATGSFHDDSRRNGFVYAAVVSPSDVWVYNNLGDEHEVVLVGPVAFSGAERVVNGIATR